MKCLVFQSSAEIEQKFNEMNVDKTAISIMIEKFQFLVVEIPVVRNVTANIIKQEMLVLGGEAAVDQNTISCQVETTPMLISGTKKTFRRLIERIRYYDSDDMKHIALELEDLIF